MNDVFAGFATICFVFQTSFLFGDSDNVLAEIDVPKLGDRLSVPIESDGRSLIYILDTGATRTCVAKSIAAKWQPIRHEPLHALTETVQVPIYERPEAESFAGMVLRRRTELYAQDFRSISDFTGIEIDGVLGMNDLKRFVIQIDFDNGKLRILRSAARELGEKFRLSSKRGCPTIDIRVNELEIDANIDTGASSDVLLTANRFDQLVEQKQIIIGVSTQIATATGVATVSKGTLQNKMSLGSFEHSGCRVTKTQFNAVGLGYLSRFVVTFDFPHEAMYLKPGKAYDRPAYHDALGVGVLFQNKQIVVSDVNSNSPAEDAAIQQGDVLKQIDGKDTTNLSLFEIRRRFCQDGKRLKLQFEREGKLRDVTITLRKYD